jgi:hypothetical protein
MRQIGNAYRILMRNPEEKGVLGGCRHRFEEDIKENVKRI